MTATDLYHVLSSLAQYGRMDAVLRPRKATPGIIQTHVGQVSVQLYHIKGVSATG